MIEYHQNRYARELDKWAPPGCRWLDIGAGTRLHGGWGGTPQESHAVRVRQLVGCDMLTEPLRQNPFLTSRVAASGDRLPFADGSFDLVTANMVLEHLEDPPRFFAEVFRVLDQGGRFVFVTPNRHHPIVALFAICLHPRVRSFVAKIADRRPAERIFLTHYRANTLGRLAQLMAGAGLGVIELTCFSSYPVTKNIPVLHSLEEAWLWASRGHWADRIRSNLLGVCQRPAIVVTTASHSLGGSGRQAAGRR